jgi:MFS transporter, PAT family, beta-lactamase induction signal transducer AmpG
MPPPLFGVLFVPSGICQGFISVVLGYLLSQHGVGVADIAALVGLRLLPETWSFLAGPLIDSCLGSVRWYLIAIAALILCFVGIAFYPLETGNSGLLGALSLASGITSVLSTSAASGILALTTAEAVRGACAGWRQTGWLGGIGLGGGGALWLATHAGGLRTAALTSAAVYLACLFPFMIVNVPVAVRGASVAAAGREALLALWKLMRTRGGVLAAIAVTIPAGIGAAAYLMPAVAGEWHASADVVATVTRPVISATAFPGARCSYGARWRARWPKAS